MDKDTIEAYDLKYGSSRLALPDGGELYYERYGQGPALTVVNNFFLISPLWKNFTKKIACDARILAYDLRNQGSSSVVEGDIPFSSLIDDLRDLLDGLGIEKTYLLGTSTSTLICRDFALAYPERVRGMVLVGPLFCPYGSQRRKYLTRSWLNSLDSGGTAGLFAHIFPLVYSDRTIETGGTPAYLALRERFLAVNSKAQLSQFLKASLTTDDDPQKLRRITCPVLLMAGEADFLSSPMSLAASCDLMPDARLEIIDFAGHVPYFEATGRFEQLVQGFVEEIEARHAA